MWNCELCNVTFDKVTKYAAHKSVHVKRGEIPRDPFKGYEKRVNCNICKKSFANESRLNTHLKSRVHSNVPKNCEICQTFHDGKFGSGRFCSRSCSNSSSTSKKRHEINKKVSQALKGKTRTQIQRVCKTCNQSFQVIPSGKQFCSRKCSYSKQISSEYREKCSERMIEKYKNGREVSGGYTKRIEVETSNGIFKVQGSFEKRACLIFDSLLSQGLIKSWSYNKKRFPYVWREKNHTYLPDFEVHFKDVSMFVETKGYVRENDSTKWEALRTLGHKLEIWTLKILKLYEKS